jgi:hypothetical protein
LLGLRGLAATVYSRERLVPGIRAGGACSAAATWSLLLAAAGSSQSWGHPQWPRRPTGLRAPRWQGRAQGGPGPSPSRQIHKSVTVRWALGRRGWRRQLSDLGPGRLGPRAGRHCPKLRLQSCQSRWAWDSVSDSNPGPPEGRWVEHGASFATDPHGECSALSSPSHSETLSKRGLAEVTHWTTICART